MKVDSKEVVFLSGVRTPFGSFGGSLKGHSATDLAVVASKATIKRAGVSPEDIDQTIIAVSYTHLTLPTIYSV